MNGYLEKKSSGMFKSWQRRFFRMENLHLVYFDSENDMEAKNSIDLRHTLLVGMGEKSQAAKGALPPDTKYVHLYLSPLRFRRPTNINDKSTFDLFLLRMQGVLVRAARPCVRAARTDERGGHGVDAESTGV